MGRAMMENPILFFDGSCGMCSRAVQYLLPRTQAQVSFAPLFGETYQQLKLPEHVPDTLILYVRGKTLFYSSAIVGLFPWAKGSLRWQIAGLVCFPPFMRNGVYRWIAKNRKKWNTRSCPFLSSADHARILP